MAVEEEIEEEKGGDRRQHRRTATRPHGGQEDKKQKDHRHIDDAQVGSDGDHTEGEHEERGSGREVAAQRSARSLLQPGRRDHPGS
ncbi:MAG: hypothetical protein QM692_00855 [Thermomicrobiales bacterium]